MMAPWFEGNVAMTTFKFPSVTSGRMSVKFGSERLPDGRIGTYLLCGRRLIDLLQGFGGMELQAEMFSLLTIAIINVTV